MNGRRREIEQFFPGLKTRPYQITSSATQEYNCIAWAAGENHRWWWPLPLHPKNFWPSEVLRVTNLDSFIKAFQSIGYEVCESFILEQEVEKIALFADENEIPTHAARQLPNGRWTSKLGQIEDIEHDLRDVEGELYGRAVIFMKRQRR